MKLIKVLFLAFACCFLAMDCENNDDEVVKANPPQLNFTAEYNGEALIILDQEYAYEDGMELRFQLFQFFISDVKLIDDSGNETGALIDVATISFANSIDQNSAEEGVSVDLNEVPTGKYTAIKFGVGVGPTLNATQPGDYTPGHPLSTDYWSAASSYVFSKVEGNADLDGNNSFDTKLTFHIGGNPRYREVILQKDIQVDAEGAEPINLKVDLKDVLVNDEGQFVNFKEITQIHNGTAETAVFMMDNLASAISIR